MSCVAGCLSQLQLTQKAASKPRCVHHSAEIASLKTRGEPGGPRALRKAVFLARRGQVLSSSYMAFPSCVFREGRDEGKKEGGREKVLPLRHESNPATKIVAGSLFEPPTTS